MARKEILILEDMIPDGGGQVAESSGETPCPQPAGGRRRTPIRIVCFWALVAVLIAAMNGVIGIGDDGYDNRGRIASFYRQPENTIDVVFIGGSTMYRGWSSMVAWREYGITSYSYSTSAQPTAAHRFIIEDIKKTQSPKVFVLGLRSYRSDPEPTDSNITGAIRKVTDNMPFSLNRLHAIDYMLDSIGIETDNHNFDYYFSFMLYHNRWTEGKKALNIGPDRYNKTQGTRIGKEIFRVYDFPVEKLSKPTAKAAPLSANTEKNLNDLTDYLKDSGDEATFLLLPYLASEHDRELFNTVKSILDEKGFSYIDLLDSAAEMGIDYKTDFYDKTHLNVYGMDKSTRFLSEYLIREYGLEDHRGDPKYAVWDDAYDEYVSQMKDYMEKEDAAPPTSFEGVR
ncbi:MAG: hypothetical protein LBS67_04005 [Clostridiales Family XIII bacterium]|jgi:hypothetical protein|nr:hypothetical protein [Clostridiales Family XIII bacterium]